MGSKLPCGSAAPDFAIFGCADADIDDCSQPEADTVGPTFALAEFDREGGERSNCSAALQVQRFKRAAVRTCQRAFSSKETYDSVDLSYSKNIELSLYRGAKCSFSFKHKGIVI